MSSEILPRPSAPSLAVGLRGLRIIVLNWRDVRHPLAGGAEFYIHEIARRWVSEGAVVTWVTARPGGMPSRETVDGIRIRRMGGTFTLYARAALRLVRTRDDVDAVIDCQNGIPFFSPLLVGRVPVVQVVHHVHQDQFATRFPRPLAALGRLLEGHVARHVYRTRAIAAVSPSTRSELRHRLAFSGPIFVVPNGIAPVPVVSGPRDPDPTIVVVSRLVPHKRIDLLLGELVGVAAKVPRLRVHVVGDGRERSRLEGLAADLGLADLVTFHGRRPDAVRDDLLSRAWLTTSTSLSEGWGCSIVEAAAWGTPCVGLRVPGVRDSVVHGVTGWLVDHVPHLGERIETALDELQDEGRAQETAAACRAWADCFSWDRSAGLLAGVVSREIAASDRSARRLPERRAARTDIAARVRFRRRPDLDLRVALRSTDEVSETAEETTVLLVGCDDFGASGVLRRLGVSGGAVDLVSAHELLAGPSGPVADARAQDGAVR